MEESSETNVSTLKNKNVESTDPEKYKGPNLNFKNRINWELTSIIVAVHVLGFYGIYLIFQGKIENATIIWTLVLVQLSNIGVSVGSHRYFCHKSFKAKPLLEAILIVLHTMSCQFSVLTWARNHRQHHQYSDTDGDPHNSKRGVFYCYMGWLFTRSDDKTIQEKVYVDDLLQNKMVMFEYNYYIPMQILVTVLIPTFVPVYFFNESWWNSFLVAVCVRVIIQLNYTMTVVVTGHNIGTRPYDKNIQPTDSWILSILTWGDNNHNFHHVFPWDYKNAEDSNLISRIIVFCEKIGLVSNLKEVPKDMVITRVLRTGDGTHPIIGKEKRKSATSG